MLNLKLSHKCNTVMREAFENGLRKWAKRQPQKIVPSRCAEMVADGLAHNAGVYRRPDVTLNVTTRTWGQLKQLKAV